MELQNLLKRPLAITLALSVLHQVALIFIHHLVHID